MTHHHWQPVIYNVRHPKEAVERKAPYKMGVQVMVLGDTAYVSLLADKGMQPEIFQAFLNDCREMGFKRVVYEKPGGRHREYEL